MLMAGGPEVLSRSPAYRTVMPAFLSEFRVYPGTIGASPDVLTRNRSHQLQRFSRIMGRPPGPLDGVTRFYYRVRRYALCPAALRERILHGPLLGRFPTER